MGHYAGEMGYTSTRDVSWLKWGFRCMYMGTNDLLVCPVCYATLPELRVNMSYGHEPDSYRTPWMDHVIWHENVENSKYAEFEWYWPVFPDDKMVAHAMRNAIEQYRQEHYS